MYLAVVFIWTGELNRQRNLYCMLRCMNALLRWPKKYLFRFALKISKSVYFSFRNISAWRREQCLHYSTLFVFVRYYSSSYDLPYVYLRNISPYLHLEQDCILCFILTSVSDGIRNEETVSYHWQAYCGFHFFFFFFCDFKIFLHTIKVVPCYDF